MIINIRGTSGSGKSTLVHRLLKEYPSVEIYDQFSDWKKPKVVAYKAHKSVYSLPIYVIGSYKTQCGGCDSLSYKGAFEDMEAMIRKYMNKGNVIFEGLTVSSTYGRFLKISQEGNAFSWLFMDTPEEVCHQRILARNGGKEPKHDAKGLADYQRKHRGCVKQAEKLTELGEHVQWISSDDSGYQKLISLLE